VNNHSSHIYASTINFYREKKVVILTEFPPGASRRFQPLGESSFGAIKIFYDEACDSILVSDPDAGIRARQTGTVLRKAYLSHQHRKWI
jgi:hypothetical protein